MRDDNYDDDDDDHDTMVIVPQTELVAIRFWLRNIYGFPFPSFRSPVAAHFALQICAKADFTFPVLQPQHI